MHPGLPPNRTTQPSLESYVILAESRAAGTGYGARFVHEGPNALAKKFRVLPVTWQRPPRAENRALNAPEFERVGVHSVVGRGAARRKDPWREEALSR